MDLADMLGYPSSSNIYTSSKLTDIANYYGLYIQDDFRVTRKLTINIGMRWEHEPGVYEQNNGMIVNFDGTAANPLAAKVSGISDKEKSSTRETAVRPPSATRTPANGVRDSAWPINWRRRP